MTIAAHPHHLARGRVRRTWPLAGVLFVAGVFLAFAALSFLAWRVVGYSQTVDVLVEQRDAAVSSAEVANARLVEVGAEPVPVPSTGGAVNP